MNIKKIIAVILSLLLISHISPAVLADDGLYIVTPLDGSVISNTQKTFEASIPAGKNPTNTFFYLDGKFIGDGGISAAVTIEEDMYVGKHTLELRAVYDDGTGEIAISDFYAILKHQMMDFEEYEVAEYTNVGDAKVLTCIDRFGDLFGKANVEIAEDAVNGKVFKLTKIPDTATLYAGGGCFYIPVIAGNATNIAQTTGTLILEFDYAVGRAEHWRTGLHVTPYPASGKDKIAGIVLQDNNSGRGISRTQYEIKDTGWHHWKIVFDLDAKTYSVDLDENQSVLSGNIGFPNDPLETNFAAYKIGIDMSVEDVSFDNIKIGMEGAMDDYSGISDVDFVNANGETVTDSAVVPRDVQKLIVKSERAFNIDTVIPSNIEVNLGGKAAKITEAILSEDGKEITLILDNPSTITDNGEGYVSLSEKIGFSSGSTIGVRTVYKLDTEASGFMVKSVDFEKSDSKLFVSSMLKDGDVIKANIDFQNITSAPEKLTAVLVIKDGNKYVSLSAKDIEVPVTGDTDYEVTVSSAAIGTIENPEVYVMLLDSLNSGMYIDSYDLPK